MIRAACSSRSAAASNPCDLDLGGLEAAYDVLAWYRVTGDTAPVYENDRDRLAPSLRERQEWFADLTGADMAAAEEYRLRLWRDVVAAFESHDVFVWPTDLTDPYRHDDETTSLSHDWRLLLVAPLLNLPAISVPCGFSAAGTPRGLQVDRTTGRGLAGVCRSLMHTNGPPGTGSAGPPCRDRGGEPAGTESRDGTSRERRVRRTWTSRPQHAGGVGFSGITALGHHRAFGCRDGDSPKGDASGVRERPARGPFASSLAKRVTPCERRRAILAPARSRGCSPSGAVPGTCSSRRVLFILALFLLSRLPFETRWFNRIALPLQPRFWPAIVLGTFAFFSGLYLLQSLLAWNRSGPSPVCGAG